LYQNLCTETILLPLAKQANKQKTLSQALVLHAFNPSYSGGRDQEDHSSKLAGANKFMRLYLKKPSTKIGLVEWLKLKALSSNPSTAKNKNKKSIKPDA
jgi:hypothetical protein